MSERDSMCTGFMRFECRHCGSPMRISESTAPAPLVREVIVQCSNPLCGFICQVDIDASRVLQREPVKVGTTPEQLNLV